MGDSKVSRETLEAVYEAARGLCFGEDWNHGTHAKKYRLLLRDAVERAADERLLNYANECIENFRALD